MIGNLIQNIKALFVIQKSRADNFIENIKFYLNKFLIFRFIFKLKGKSDNSILIFGLLVLWSNICVAIARGVGIWYFGLWDHFSVYLSGTLVGGLISILIVLVKYFKINNYFSKFKENKKRLVMYENYLISKQKVEINVWLKRIGSK
jgi:hypothetical protein